MIYINRCLPLAQRAQFQKNGVGTNNLAWAFHSETQEELLNLIPSYAKGEPTWNVLRELGVGWWIRGLAVLKQCVQVLAKAAYQANQDPMDAALYYLAMQKKNLLWGLYRYMEILMWLLHLLLVTFICLLQVQER